MLIKGVQATLQFTIASELDVDTLIDGESDEI
jgi:hypothetical protein